MPNRDLVNKLLPIGSKRRKLVKSALPRRKIPAAESTQKLTYEQWIDKCEPILFKNSAENIQTLTRKPLVSIVVPCYNTPENYIEPLVSSILGQLYTNWQLCLADGSSDKAARKRIQNLSQSDERITYIPLTKNFGIVGNTNLALKKAHGEFIAFMDHDDTLSPFALAEVVIALNKKPAPDLVYSDEDKLSDNGQTRLLPFFKPDWSPDLLLGVNYITHFVVARKSLVDKISGLRSGFDGAQDYDFLLRLVEQTSSIVHVPKILYHWRLAKGSTAKNVGEKNYADTAGQRALADAVKRRGMKAEAVGIADRPTNYRVQYKLPKTEPLTSIIIPFKDKANLLKQCVGSILEKTTYQNYELILISNNSTEPALFKYLAELEKNKRCKVFRWDKPFNYSAINNFGRSKSSGEYLVLLNNDTEVITPNWLEELIGVASQPKVGAVGPMLFYPNKTIQHAGIILGMGTMAGHVFRHRVANDWTDFGMPAWPRNYLAVTGACLAIKTSKYDEVGGLDEVFTVAGSDVALGISLYEKGYRNVYWPFAELIHHESVSVGTYHNGIQLDYDHSLDYYGPYLNWHDPYFNPNLSLDDEAVSIRSSYDN